MTRIGSEMVTEQQRTEIESIRLKVREFWLSKINDDTLTKFATFILLTFGYTMNDITANDVDCYLIESKRERERESWRHSIPVPEETREQTARRARWLKSMQRDPIYFNGKIYKAK